MNIPKEVILENVECPLGCSKSDEVVLTGHDLIHDLSGEFTIVECQRCGLMRTNPRPNADSMGFYYPDDYGPYVGTRVLDVDPKPIKGIKKLFKAIFGLVINSNSQTLPTMPPGRMLEIGCASGAFLERMAGLGWQVQGIEFSEKVAHVAAKLGFHVHAGPLETAPDPDEPFDLIVGWMVLEHLHDPIGCLKKLRKWAKPGALLALSIPNAGSIEFSIFKDKWYALQLPHHLHHFTPHTLSLVLNASGWKLEKIHHQRVLKNLISSTGYVLRDKGFIKLGQRFINIHDRAGRWVYVLYPLAWVLSLFGQTGRMTIWARPSINTGDEK